LSGNDRHFTCEQINNLSPEDFEKAWNATFSHEIVSSILSKDLRYQDVDIFDHNESLLQIIKAVNGDVAKAGNHRIQDWECGWSQNLNSIQHNNDLLQSITPAYYGKYKVCRWKQSFIKPVNNLFDFNIINIIVEWCFDQYIRGVDAFYEFGCGPGHNLITARHFNKNAEIYGCDWTESSQKIVNEISYITNDKKMFSRKFNFFDIDELFILKPNAAIFTLASLEQTATNYVDFVNYIIKSKPRICIHIEPIAELLDDNNLLDYLSILYFNKRNYLKGFLEFLRSLEQEGKIEILRAQRTYTGSLMIEGHSVVIWRPKQ